MLAALGAARCPNTCGTVVAVELHLWGKAYKIATEKMNTR
jgi:hypothetical protein